MLTQVVSQVDAVTLAGMASLAAAFLLSTLRLGLSLLRRR